MTVAWLGLLQLEKLRRRLRFRTALFALFTVFAQNATAAQALQIACLAPVDDSPGALEASRNASISKNIPGLGLLFRGKTGLFLLKLVDGVLVAHDVFDTGWVTSSGDIPGIGTLFGAGKGLFLARVINGALDITTVGTAEIGAVQAISRWSNTGLLVEAEGRLFLVLAANGTLTVKPANQIKTGTIRSVKTLPGEMALIIADDGMFQASIENDTLIISPTAVALTDVNVSSGMSNVEFIDDLVDGRALIRSDLGLTLATPANGTFIFNRIVSEAHVDRSVLEVHDLNGGASLIRVDDSLYWVTVDSGWAKAKLVHTGDGIQVHRLQSGEALIYSDSKLFVTRASDESLISQPDDLTEMWDVREFHNLPGVGVLIEAEKGFFLRRIVNGTPVMDTIVRNEHSSSPETFRDLPGGGVLIAADSGLVLARAVENLPVFDRIDTGYVRDIKTLDSTMLIGAEKGLFVARVASGVRLVEPSGAATGPVKQLVEFPGIGALVLAAKGWFLARISDDAIMINQVIALKDPAEAWYSHSIPGLGVLIGGEIGWFLVRPQNGSVALEPAGTADLGSRIEFTNVPGSILIETTVPGSDSINPKWLAFYTVMTPLSHANVSINDKDTFEESLIDKTPRYVVLRMVHDCTTVADKLDLQVAVVRPGEKPIYYANPIVKPGATAAEVALPVRADKAGQWRFQLVSASGGVFRPVGEEQHLNFRSPGAKSWLEEWWKWLTGALVAVLAAGNIALFCFARRSAWAWRVATDDGWSSGVLRVATLLLSHFPKAQLWILDLYFERAHRIHRVATPPPFLPMPLTGNDGKLQASTHAVAPPWRNRRLWIQGGSGMGKTALFRFLIGAHFRDHKTAFAAYAKWGCILVAFSARNFAAGGDDKDDPRWVVDAVRATLSSQGLTFANDGLLQRFLESGTIAVAIDGLNEVDRTRAVMAFARTFAEAPVFVTSQVVGEEPFQTLRLPPDVRAFTLDLLKLHLQARQAERIFARINASGLNDAIRSGYDVRLLTDLVRSDPVHATLPRDRMGLYAAVIEAGWPDGSPEARREQQYRISAAAWGMVSERKPNEDMRRLKPNVDLAADLLDALADAPEKESKPVKLLRRVGDETFEFVHDQMHAYLAACWFAQDGFSVSELEKMVASSTIWTQAPEARQTLWGFAAALLDDDRLALLWARVEDKEEWDGLRRALKTEAERRGLRQPPAA